MTYLTAEFSPSAQGEYAEKRFGLTNDRITVLGIEFRCVVTGI